MGSGGGTLVGVGDLVDGKYRIIRAIGEGGWGIVFEGENVRTYKHVAIKILRPHSGVTKDILSRFEREAQAAGRIGSEHIVEVYDLGSLDDGTHYMVMELLTGEEFAARLRAGGPLDPVAVAKIILQLLDGLKAAHDAGILHRDLKPENLFLVPTRSGEEFVKILDFGISKFNNGPQGSATMTGAVLGSPCYMAPEQARGLKQIDVRTDLYAVGTLMFESLTGRVPFEGDNFNDLMFKIVLAPRPDPRALRPDLDPGMAEIVVKAMAIDPIQRFQNADELSAALGDWLASKGISSVRPPELKRAYSTSRNSREVTPGASGPKRRPATPVEKATVREAGGAPHGQSSDPSRPPWSDATMPAEMGLSTPLVSSSSEVRTAAPTGGSRKGLVAVVAIAAVAAVVAGGVLVGRGHRAGTATAGPVVAPPTISAALVVPASSPTPTASLAPPEIESSTPTEVASASASAAPAHTALRGFSRFGPLPKAAPVPPPPPKPTEVAPPPPATAAAPAKPVSTVEGREIRTGL